MRITHVYQFEVGINWRPSGPDKTYPQMGERIRDAIIDTLEDHPYDIDPDGFYIHHKPHRVKGWRLGPCKVWWDR